MLKNEPISCLTHFIGFLLSIAALVLLVVLALRHGRVEHIVGFSIFGAGLILLYMASTLYHFVSRTHRLKEIFKGVDRSMIYILIASTYTPIILVLPNSGYRWTIFGIIWALAITGILLQFIKRNKKSWLDTVLYIVMGWLILLIFPILQSTFPMVGIAWLTLGGVLYTLGVIFVALERLYPSDRLFGMHEIFHIFVMGGSFSHFWFMLRYVLYT